MKMKQQNRYLVVFFFAIGVGPVALHAQDVPLADIPDTLTSKQRFELEKIRSHLQIEISAYEQIANSFNASCGSVNVNDHPKIAECTSQYKDMSARADTLYAEKRAFAAQVSAAVASARNPPPPSSNLTDAQRKAICGNNKADCVDARDAVSGSGCSGPNCKQVSNSFFGEKAADPNDPKAPFHVTGSTAPTVPVNGTDTDPMHQAKVVNGNSSGAATTGPGDAGNDTSKPLSGVGFDTGGTGPGKGVDAPVVTPHAELVLTPEQSKLVQEKLKNNADYQRLQAEQVQAVKDAARAAQVQKDAQARYDALPDNSPDKKQAAVALSNATDASTRAQTTVAANQMSQDEIKAGIVRVIIVPPTPKPKPVEPPVPGSLQDKTAPPANNPPGVH